MVMRLYWPKADALNGRWTAPPLVPVVSDKEAAATGAAVPVTPENFARAESDRYFGNLVKEGGFGQFIPSPGAGGDRQPDRHPAQSRYALFVGGVRPRRRAGDDRRCPTPASGSCRCRSSTRTSTRPRSITAPEATPSPRRRSEHAMSWSRFGRWSIPNDPKDVEAVHALQDAIKVDQPGGPGKFETPNWDQASQKTVRDGLLMLATTLPDTKGMFGPRGGVDPVEAADRGGLGLGRQSGEGRALSQRHSRAGTTARRSTG